MREADLGHFDRQGLQQQQQDWQALKWASEEMKLDREIIGVATGVKAEALQGASDEKIRTMVSLRTGGKELRNLSEEMKGDRELCMAAVAQNGIGQLPASRSRSYLPPAW